MADKLLSLAYAFDKRFRYRFKLKQLFSAFCKSIIFSSMTSPTNVRLCSFAVANFINIPPQYDLKLFYIFSKKTKIPFRFQQTASKVPGVPSRKRKWRLTMQ